MFTTMQRAVRVIAAVTLASWAAIGHADDFSTTASLFRNSHESSSYFGRSYGYAIFPTVGEGGFIVAGAHGTGQVYVRGRHVGNASMTEVSVGAQAGGQAYSEIVFFRDRRAFEAFTSGHFALGATASVVVITAAAEADAGTQGASAGASGGRKDAATKGGFHDGMAIFTIVKGGAMLQAAVNGQKFSYTPVDR